VSNQFSLLSGIFGSSTLRNVHIDLLDSSEKPCLKIIELKAWNKQDSPIYALLELLRYFFSYKRLALVDNDEYSAFNEFSTFDLFVLAPKSYYNTWDTSVEDLERISTISTNVLLKNNINDISISFRKLDIERSDFKSLEWKINDRHKRVFESNQKFRASYLRAVE